jgi:hypothetical protein
MTLTTGDVLRVVASLLWTDGNVNQNVFNCVLGGSGSPWDDQDILDDSEDWLDNMYGNLTNNLSDYILGNEVVVYKYDTINEDWDEVGANSWSWIGSASFDELPRGVAGLLRLWTEDPDVQGKKYIPGLTETATTDGLFGSGTIVNLLAFAADWYAPFVGTASGADFTPGVWSVVQSLLIPAVDHIATSTIPAYQRRRKRNVGI